MSDEVFDDGSGFPADDPTNGWGSSYDTSNMDESSLDPGGMITVGGQYHMFVSSVKAPPAPNPEDKNPSTPCWNICVKVLAAKYGDDRDTQINKVMFLRVWLRKKVTEKDANGVEQFVRFDMPAEGSIKSALRIALGLRLIEKSDIGKPNLVIPWWLAEGRQFCGEVVMEEDVNPRTGKKSLKPEIPFGEIYPVDDERVQDWPKDVEALASGQISAGGNHDDLGDI